jgi:hypothetical protein
MFKAKQSVLAIVLLLTPAAVSCRQVTETQKLINEINANETKCQALTKEADAKRAEAHRQLSDGQTAERQKSIDAAANLYDQIARLLN